MQKKLAVIVLAAGQGKRMKSPLAKVLQPLAGKPLIAHVLDILLPLCPDRQIVVVGFQAARVQGACAGRPVEFVVQEEQLGTGHAVRQAEAALSDHEGDVLVLCGDMPFIKSESIKNLVETHRSTGAACTLLILKTRKLNDYGRILRDARGEVARIVEKSEAGAKEISVDEFNSGVYCFNKDLLFKALGEIGCGNAQNEYYLTDTLEYFASRRLPLASVLTEDADEIFGVNSPEDLKRAEALLAGRS